MPVLTAKILAHTDHTHERRKPDPLVWWHGLRWFAVSGFVVFGLVVAVEREVVSLVAKLLNGDEEVFRFAVTGFLRVA